MSSGAPVTSEEASVEQRASDRVRQNAPALAEEYVRRFGNEISTDNAREVVSPEYAASKEARTLWSKATQKPAGALSDHLFEQALQHPDPSKPRIVVFTAWRNGGREDHGTEKQPRPNRRRAVPIRQQPGKQEIERSESRRGKKRGQPGPHHSCDSEPGRSVNGRGVAPRYGRGAGRGSRCPRANVSGFGGEHQVLGATLCERSRG